MAVKTYPKTPKKKPENTSKYANEAQLQEIEKRKVSDTKIALESSRRNALERGQELPQLINGDITTRGQLKSEEIERVNRDRQRRAELLSQEQIKAAGLDIPLPEQIPNAPIQKAPNIPISENDNLATGIVKSVANIPQFREAATVLTQSLDVLETFNPITGIGKELKTAGDYKNTFSDSTGILSKNIEAIKSGSPVDVNAIKRDYENSMIAINQLEALQHSKGFMNTRYWATNGIKAETEIAQEKAILEDMRRDLILAIEARSRLQVGLV